jgi:hypothetical protein
MFICSNSLSQKLRLMMLRCLSLAALALMLTGALLSVRAQTPTPTPFSSGSTGAHGAFSDTVFPADFCARSGSRITCTPPPDGIFHFTTVNITRSVDVVFRPNSRNTPVTILATGDVSIANTFYLNGEGGIDANSIGGRGGPGGFRGGNGGVWLSDPSGKSGDGPGGGAGAAATLDGSDASGGGGGSFFTPGDTGTSGGPNPGLAGRTYGSKILLPLIGGSGGGGSSAYLNGIGGAGGGGGGAILIASSSQITFVGSDIGIQAIGGSAGCSNSICGGAGSGGAIRLVANTIIGSPLLLAYGGDRRGFRGNFGGVGYVRYEAFNLEDFRPTFGGQFGNFSFGRPNPVMLPNDPQLRILSIGGINAPAQPTGSFYTAQPDVVVPESVSNPVNVVVQGTNVPGTPTIQVTRITDSGEREMKTCTLTNNTCTASLSLQLTRTSLIIATTTVDGLLAFGRPIFIDGERVNKVEIAAAFGGQSEITYITDSGRRLKWPQ